MKSSFLDVASDDDVAQRGLLATFVAAFPISMALIEGWLPLSIGATDPIATLLPY